MSRVYRWCPIAQAHRPVSVAPFRIVIDRARLEQILRGRP